MSKILIKNGKVWDGEKFLFADILTEGKVIAKLQESISDDADFIFDADGKIVAPGLVDIHVHMRGIAIEAFGVEPQMSSLPFGVTAVNDAGSSCGDRMLLNSFAVKNTVFVCADIRNNRSDFTRTEKLLQKYGDKAIGIKVYFDTSLTEVSNIVPLKEICDYAQARKLKVMVHCSNSPTSMVEIVNTLSEGDILTHAYHGGKNNVSEDGFECIKSAKSRGVIIDAGLAGYVHTDFKVFEDAISCGALPDVISTDITRFSAYKRGGRYGMTMCMSIANALGMSEEDIFRAVTSVPARALGKENEWGHLKVGRCADIAVFDYKDEAFDLTDNAGHQIISNKGYRCVLTVVDGEIIYKD